jgi:hypothetical protein
VSSTPRLLAAGLIAVAIAFATPDGHAQNAPRPRRDVFGMRIDFAFGGATCGTMTCSGLSSSAQGYAARVELEGEGWLGELPISVGARVGHAGYGVLVNASVGLGSRVHPLVTLMLSALPGFVYNTTFLPPSAVDPLLGLAGTAIFHAGGFTLSAAFRVETTLRRVDIMGSMGAGFGI